jgi:hypothetical protein
MRLINVKTFELEEFHDEKSVKYAILSHRWETEEVLYKDMMTESDRTRAKSLKGWYKVEKCCEQAAVDKLSYVWVDTCCIDKSSSAELQEAINSMYRWYASSEVCYAYLSDVTASLRIRNSAASSAILYSEWFRRGWTLQELLAPEQLVFLDSQWFQLCSRESQAALLREALGIPKTILESGFKHTSDKPYVADIMTWANDRKITHIEDRAYSLLGLFDVHMPLLYGEGEKAFVRLQEEILKQSKRSNHICLDWRIS